ncbi:non-homologous end joining protein Ku [Streptomyces candidus]|uniref:Non-homologous end joining protein Ku n=1 Tax=Streptomyces candidus TaxID=67283 RepID=A0A7X0LSJ5_9ACTN|nr:Ku protein [Streptomyces candidus]MBB6438539.1 DNA end-binding protein Ku [Streptomyces candidus]GHH45529.1 non-homologous end joining protein Ku [Streptomyces candidus]
MPRPVWSGAVSFGLVTIPIKVLPATENHQISFHQYHVEDMGRIRYQKVCALDGEVLSPDEIGRGYEVSKDTIVEITDEELDNMPLPTAKAIEIVAFVPADSIDPVRIGDSYYLSADGAVAAKPYVLLRKALERSSKVAVAKFAWHGRERLGLLRVMEDALVLHAMKWPDEIRSPDELAPRTVDLDDKEVDAAISLMEEMTTDDGLEGYRDHYREALEDLLAAKAHGEKPPVADTGGKPEETVVDLMAALQQSVESARASRGETTGEDGKDASVHDLTGHAQKKAARAKKATAKKTSKTAKKAPAKKAPRRTTA